MGLDGDDAIGINRGFGFDGSVSIDGVLKRGIDRQVDIVHQAVLTGTGQCAGIGRGLGGTALQVGIATVKH